MITGRSWGTTGTRGSSQYLTNRLCLPKNGASGQEGIPQGLKPASVTRQDVQAKAWTYPEAKNGSVLFGFHPVFLFSILYAPKYPAAPPAGTRTIKRARASMPSPAFGLGVVIRITRETARTPAITQPMMHAV